jgi:hypothetical protein
MKGLAKKYRPATSFLFFPENFCCAPIIQPPHLSLCDDKLQKLLAHMRKPVIAGELEDV